MSCSFQEKVKDFEYTQNEKATLPHVERLDLLFVVHRNAVAAGRGKRHGKDGQGHWRHAAHEPHGALPVCPHALAAVTL